MRPTLLNILTITFISVYSLFAAPVTQNQSPNRLYTHDLNDPIDYSQDKRRKVVLSLDLSEADIESSFNDEYELMDGDFVDQGSGNQIIEEFQTCFNPVITESLNKDETFEGALESLAHLLPRQASAIIEPYFKEAIKLVAESIVSIMTFPPIKELVELVFTRAQEFKKANPERQFKNFMYEDYTTFLAMAYDPILDHLKELPEIIDEKPMGCFCLSKHLLILSQFIARLAKLHQNPTFEYMLKVKPDFKTLFSEFVEFGNEFFEPTIQKILYDLESFAESDIGIASLNAEDILSDLEDQKKTRSKFPLRVNPNTAFLSTVWNSAMPKDKAAQVIKIAAERAEANTKDSNAHFHAFLIKEGYKHMLRLSKTVPLMHPDAVKNLLIRSTTGLTPGCATYIQRLAMKNSDSGTASYLADLTNFVSSDHGKYAFNQQEIISTFSENVDGVLSVFEDQMEQQLSPFPLPVIQITVFIFKLLRTVLSTEVATKIERIASQRAAKNAGAPEPRAHAQLIEVGSKYMKEFCKIVPLLPPDVIKEVLSRRTDVSKYASSSIFLIMLLALEKSEPSKTCEFVHLMNFITSEYGAHALNQENIVAKLSELSNSAYFHCDNVQIQLAQIFFNEWLKVASSPTTKQIILESLSLRGYSDHLDFEEDASKEKEALEQPVLEPEKEQSKISLGFEGALEKLAQIFSTAEKISSYNIVASYYKKGIKLVAESMLFVLDCPETIENVKKVWGRIQHFKKEHPESCCEYKIKEYHWYQYFDGPYSEFSDAIYHSVYKGLKDLSSAIDEKRVEDLKGLPVLCRLISMLASLSQPFHFQDLFSAIVEFGETFFTDKMSFKMASLRCFMTSDIGKYSLGVHGLLSNFEQRVNKEPNMSALPLFATRSRAFLSEICYNLLSEDVASQIISIAARRAACNTEDFDPFGHAVLIREGYKYLKKVAGWGSQPVTEDFNALANERAISDISSFTSTGFSPNVQLDLNKSPSEAACSLFFLTEFLASKSGVYAFDQNDIMAELSTYYPQDNDKVELAQILLKEGLKVLVSGTTEQIVNEYLNFSEASQHAEATGIFSKAAMYQNDIFIQDDIVPISAPIENSESFPTFLSLGMPISGGSRNENSNLLHAFDE